MHFINTRQKNVATSKIDILRKRVWNQESTSSFTQAVKFILKNSNANVRH